MTVNLTNTGKRKLTIQPGDFMLTAEGDIFSQMNTPTPPSAFQPTLLPGTSSAGRITFQVPQALLPKAYLFYRAGRESKGIVASLPLSSASTGSNTIEDTFTRPNQTGWGSTTNPDGVPASPWGMDGNGSKPFVSISSNTGVYAYPGSINQIGIASASPTPYNGGDALVAFQLSAVGHATPYVVQNACADKSCYYGARLHTSQNKLELAKRISNGTLILASISFMPSAATLYWMRLDVSVGSGSTTLQAKIWAAGSAEPDWMLSVTDSSPLAPNLTGAGGSWDLAGSGESIAYSCYAFAVSALASACDATTPPPTPTPSPSPTSAATPTPTSTPSTGSNTIEDTFTRPNQTGWGSTTNPDGVPASPWGMDGNGSKPFVSISSNTGVYAYPGSINQIGIASASPTPYNGGDALVAFQLSAVGHATPYVVQNACADKSCYYGARLHTSQNKLELAKRISNGTLILASISFMPSAATLYWMRLDVSVGSGSTTLQAKIWAAGSAEPDWMLSVTDSSPLAPNLTGAGGSWDLAGSGESIAYSCYAFAVSALASACDATTPPPTPTPSPSPTPTATSIPSPTPTPTPTSSPSPTPTPTPGQITEYPLSGGVGEPWGTALDAQGNVWFAEAGCDFAPTCSPSAGPGQLGEWIASTQQTVFYKLPNIAGNQPIFVALDNSGNVWFTTPDNSMIGEFSPTSKSFVGQWAVTAGSGPWDLTFNLGQIWYTEHFVSSIGSFDPVTHSYTDYPTPSANSNPYGIAANDPANGNLIWFTENNSSVARIAVLDTGNNNTISEYPIQAQANSGLTPHLLALDAQGHPWWSEGWVRAIGTLNPAQATPGACGTTSGDCIGVHEYALPAPSNTCSGSHVSGIALQSTGLVWTDNSLSAQIGSFNPATQQFTMYNLATCGRHPHDGLNTDAASHIWWDEEFSNALGELTP